VEEEVILDWSRKPSKKHIPADVSKEIHANADPFVKWLSEAEEEDESTDDDDDGLDVRPERQRRTARGIQGGEKTYSVRSFRGWSAGRA
jgi:hypothetical protein